MEPTAVSGESMVMFGRDLQRLHPEILTKAITHAKTEAQCGGFDGVA